MTSNISVTIASVVTFPSIYCKKTSIMHAVATLDEGRTYLEAAMSACNLVLHVVYCFCITATV